MVSGSGGRVRPGGDAFLSRLPDNRGRSTTRRAVEAEPADGGELGGLGVCRSQERVRTMGGAASGWVSVLGFQAVDGAGGGEAAGVADGSGGGRVRADS